AREHGHADVPPLVQRSEKMSGGEMDIGEEHLVELRVAGHLSQRAYLDAGKVHGHEEERDPFLRGGVVIRALHQDAPVAVAPSTAPHLLAVDHELVTVESCSGREA